MLMKDRMIFGVIVRTNKTGISTYNGTLNAELLNAWPLFIPTKTPMI